MIKRLCIFVCFVLTMMCLQAKPKKASFYYLFFSPEKETGVEDSLLRISMDSHSNCAYWRDLGRNLFNNPLIVIELENKSEDIVYIDLARCFINRNKKSQMFWDNTQVVNSGGNSKDVAVNLGSITNAIGVGGVVGTLAQGISIGSGSSTSTSTIKQDERILRLPPFAVKTITVPLEYDNSIPFLGYRKANNFKWYGETYCTYAEKNVGEEVTWTAKDSPITLRAFITYSDSEQFDRMFKSNIFIYCDTMVGTREWIGSKESTKEIQGFGYSLDKPHIMVKKE